MAGRIITIAPRQTYTLNVPAGQTIAVPLGNRAYDTRDVVSGTLSVRVSAGTSLAAGTSVNALVSNAMLSDDEPNTIFINPGATPLAQVTIPATDTWPLLYWAGWSTGTGAMITVGFKFNGGASGGAITLVAGVDLVVRDS